jgi:heat shock protein HslJ
MASGLEDRRWSLTAYAAPDGTLVAVPDGVMATATFEGGIVGGSGGCNRYSGEYALTGDAITIGPLASTMMACPDPAMAVEAAFHAAMAVVARAVAHAGGLVLLDAGGRVVLEFTEAALTPLVGTPWTATGINNGHGGVTSLVAGTTATAAFADDGRVAGSAGCNRWTATFVVVGSTITIGAPAVTRRLCAGPAGIMEQEAAYIAALGRSTRLAIDGDRLDLRDDDGALQVTFSAAGGAPGASG